LSTRPPTSDCEPAATLPHRLRQAIPLEVRVWVSRRQGRLRWIRKYRRVTSFGLSLHKNPAKVLRFVLTDPEVENFSYEIENEEEMASFLADALGVSRNRIAAYMQEGHQDPELNQNLSRRVRWRWDCKSRLSLGRRIGWYALVRALRPKTVVETGIHNGLGSLVLLRAIERNAVEGDTGELISFDIVKSSGWLVPKSLRRFWTPVFESTFTALDPVLEGKSVDLLVQDLGAGREAELHDYETVWKHGSDRLVLLAASAHLTTALRSFAAARGLDYRHFRDIPRDHVFPGGGAGIVVTGHAGGG
jgi:Methyltransferase domain